MDRLRVLSCAIVTALAVLLGHSSNSRSAAFADDSALSPPSRPAEQPAISTKYAPQLPEEGTQDQLSQVDPAAPKPPSIPVLPETEVKAEPQPQVAPPTAPTAPTTAPPTAPPASNPITGPSILKGTIFMSPPVTGYMAPSSTVGTMLDTPTYSFPGTITTIPRDLIRDQQILTIDDTIRDIPSAVKAYGADGVIRPDQLFVRGFEVTSQTFRKDGYLDPSYMPRDPANMERLDVLSGPASTLYGAAQPTGTFNVTTKRAQLNPFANFGFMTGSYNLQRYTFDMNSPITRDGTVLFRLNGAYQNNDSFRTSVFNEREFLAPTTTIIIDDDTSLTWSTEYQHDRFRMDQGVPAINGDPFAISNNTFTGNRSGDVANYHSYRNTLTFERNLTDNWSMRVGEMSLWYNTPSTTTFLDNGTTGANGLLSSPIIPQDQNVASPFMEQNHDILETLNGTFDTGRFAHKAVIGAEQDWFITNHDTFTQSLGGAYGPIDVSSASSFPLTGPNQPLVQSVFDNPAFRQNRIGFFAQDQIDLTSRLKLLLGGRFDYLQQTYSRSDTVLFGGFPISTTGDIHTQDTFHQFSPRVGLTYDLIPDTMAIYGTYARSFTPSIGVVNFTQVALLPQIGDIWEGGIKTKLNDRLLLTTGGYWTRQHNVNTELFNPNAPPNTPSFSVEQVGIVRSQGAEMSLTGQITERWSTFTNASYNDTLQQSVDPTIDGKRVRGVPHVLGSIWTRYNFVQTPEKTIGAALGMRYAGAREGDYLSPLVLPSYNIWQMGFYYNRGRLGGSLLWDNIFNTNYAVASLSQYQVIPGTPSNVRIQLSYLY
jgi:iron complex outermembrane receptor protein